MNQSEMSDMVWSIRTVFDEYEHLRSPELREELAAIVHGWWVKWTQEAMEYNIDRSSVLVPYNDLQDIDKQATLREVYVILDALQR